MTCLARAWPASNRTRARSPTARYLKPAPDHAAWIARHRSTLMPGVTVADQRGMLFELWAFMKVRKKFWLLPILLVLLGVGALLIFAQGSALAPFIYTIF